MSLRSPLLLFLLCVAGSALLAQSSKPNPDKISKLTANPELADRFVPKVIPPSPDAAALARYGEVPVELSKGIPSIAIPLYEIQSGNLKLPVSLSYHASGVKVNDVASSVGLGWSLNAGGSLTRAVNGLPDDNGHGFWVDNPPALNTNELMCYIGRLAAGDGVSKDGSPDYFFYNYGTTSGKIMYANKKRTVDQNLPSFAPVTIPYRPIKINSTINEYKITEIDGSVYNFGKQVNGKGSVETTSTQAFSYNSTWYLSHMVSANRVDTIYFEYTDAVVIEVFPLYSTTLIKKDVNNGSSYTIDYERSPTINVFTNTRYPSAIYFNNGKVTFTYASDRQDLPGAKRLTAIYIYRKDAAGNYSELKHFDLEQAYFNCQDATASQFDRFPVAGGHASTNTHVLKKLKLDKVTEKSAAGIAIPAHQLGYYYDAATGKLPMYGSYAQDYYGFYNGKNGNENLLVYDTDATLTAQPSAAYGADRSVDFNFTVLGTLKEITYPTGGKTTFVYEAPVTAGGGPNVQGGGLRVKSITNMEGAAQLTKKSFSYPGAYSIGNLTPGNTFGIEVAFSTQEQVPSGNGGTPDLYTYSVWQENYPFMLGGNSGSSIAYSQVEVAQMDGNGIALGKTVSHFTQSTDGTASTFPFFTIPNEWRRGHLLEEKELNATGNIVKHVKNYYKEVLTDSLVRGFGARTLFRAQPNIIVGSYCDPFDELGRTDFQWVWMQKDYQIGAIFMDSTITLNYNEAGASGLKEKQIFSYATSTHHQLTKKTVINSKNQEQITLYRYPHDFLAIPDYAEMVNRHIYSSVIEEETKMGVTTTGITKTNYKKWYPALGYNDVQGFFAPLSVEMQYAGGALNPQIVFGEKLSAPTLDGYDDKAHPKLYTQANGTVTALSWWSEKGKRDLVNTQTVNGQLTTTYDYFPLVGVKSITDPAGKALFYEYDGYGRLVGVHSDNAAGPLRKSYCYNYAGQAVPCPAIAPTGAVNPPGLVLLPDYQGNPLPVTLVSFVAVKYEASALLTWTTSEETESAYFEVQKSSDGKTWERIGSIETKIDSKSLRYYSFRDLSPYSGRNLYRLKMVDVDASFAYSRTEALQFDNEPAIYPNPLPTGEKLRIATSDPGSITSVRIFSTQGKTVYDGRLPASGIDVSALPAGVYLIQVTEKNGSVSSHRVVKH